jgi:hypothetical protein
MLETESTVLVVDIKRSKLARAFGISIFATNWISTLGVVYFTWQRMPTWVGAAALFLRISMALTMSGAPSSHKATNPFGVFLGRFRPPSRSVISRIYFQTRRSVWHKSR